MTVKELKNKLNLFPSDTEVRVEIKAGISIDVIGTADGKNGTALIVVGYIPGYKPPFGELTKDY